jgi:hypothetical protein
MRALLSIVVILQLASCQSANETQYADNIFVCSYDGPKDMYITTYPCPPAAPETNFIRPTKWGIGGGFRIFADTTGNSIVFRSVVGDYIVNRDNTAFVFEDLSPLPRRDQLARIAEGHAVELNYDYFGRPKEGEPLISPLLE